MMSLLWASITFAQLPDGYTSEQFSTFHNNPMDIEFHPDGDKMVVAERAGLFWLYNLVNGEWVIEDEPFLDITDQVTTYFERGVQSILLGTHFIWVYYTVEESYLFPELELPVEDDSATINRISRWEVAWNQNIAVFGEDIIIGITPADGIPSLRGNHNGGGMAWGPEGTGQILFSTGDSAGGDFSSQGVDRGIIPAEHEDFSGAYRAQIKSSPNGKVHRIRSWNGTGVVGNPNYDALNQSSWDSRMYDYGYRNAFDMCYDPVRDMAIVADVGAGSKEELTKVENDGNAGWGAHEGFNQRGWNNGILDPDTGAPFALIYNNPPLLDYGHNGNALTRVRALDDSVVEDTDNPIEGNSITGGVVLKDGFGYTSHYIWGDYTRGWLNIAILDDNNLISSTINFAPASTYSATVDITQAPDGSLYIVRLFGGIDRIEFEETLSNPEVELSDSIKIIYDLNSNLYTFTGIDGDAKLFLYDISGKFITEEELYDNHVMDLSMYRSGVYLAEIEMANRKVTKKFVIR